MTTDDILNNLLAIDVTDKSLLEIKENIEALILSFRKGELTPSEFEELANDIVTELDVTKFSENAIVAQQLASLTKTLVKIITAVV